MILDILKDSELWERLEAANEEILKVSNGFEFYNGDEPYDSRANHTSVWFDPKHIKEMPTARCYPKTDTNQLRAEYSLVLFPANYLTLFLLDKLYTGQDIQIEDV